MSSDSFRLVISHGTAAFVVVGGLFGLFALMWNGRLEVDVGLPAMMLITGGAVAFLFVQEAGKQAEKAAARQTDSANVAAERVAAASGGSTVTTTGDVSTGGPTTVVGEPVTPATKKS